MRVMGFVKATENSEKGMVRDPQTMKMMEEMGKYNDELKKAGILKMAEGLEPSSKGSVLGSMDRTVTSSMGRSSQRVIWLRDSGCGK